PGSAIFTSWVLQKRKGAENRQGSFVIGLVGTDKVKHASIVAESLHCQGVGLGNPLNDANIIKRTLSKGTQIRTNESLLSRRHSSQLHAAGPNGFLLAKKIVLVEN